MVALVEIVVAALEGAWLYKEKEMMQVHAAAAWHCTHSLH